MQNNGHLAYFWWFWAIILHTLGVQEEALTNLPVRTLRFLLKGSDSGQRYTAYSQDSRSTPKDSLTSRHNQKAVQANNYRLSFQGRPSSPEYHHKRTLTKGTTLRFRKVCCPFNFSLCMGGLAGADGEPASRVGASKPGASCLPSMPC